MTLRFCVALIGRVGTYAVMDSITRQWIERAEYDLKSIPSVLEGRRYFFEQTQELMKWLKQKVK
jgi:hypothetical protein